ncbi:motility protein A [candidate division KSB1 bacterium 4484_188]|nr:MAG: motility protein A [candidate division KSB1 bacterium 4484_188]HFE65157.1 motility protein A [Caldithrix sp.]
MKKVLDIATLLGLFGGILVILLAVMIGGGLGAFINIPSMLVVIGGTVAAVLVQYPLEDVLGVIGVLRKTLLTKTSELPKLIETIVRFAEEARRDGLLTLEKHAKEIDDDFIRDGIQLAIDGTEPELLREILSTEVDNLESRHGKGHGILEAFGTYAPAFGMIGTLIGLVIMLQNMKDPSSIGPSMAVALITTFYGAVMANLIFLPLAGKLKERTKEEVHVRELIMEGILSIQSGDNPRLVEQKLKTFLPPKDRKAG